MQTRSLSFLLAAFTAVLLFASCSSKSNKEGAFIPKNAGVVLHLNGESLSSKLPWEEIKKSDLFQQASSDSNTTAFVKSILDNPENTGIDIKKDLFIFVQKDSLGGYVAVMGTVKDEAKFKQFSTEASKGAAVTEKDGISFATKERNTISWKKDRFIVIIDAPEMDNMNKKFGMDDPSVATSKTNRDGIAAATALYNLKEDNSLAKNEKFSNLLSTKGDVHFWLNGESFNGGTGMSGMAALGMINMAKLTEGSIMAATASFENGQIVADVKSYSGKELTDIWKKYSGDKISSDMASRIPSKNVAAYFALNFKPQGIQEFLKLAGLDGMANMGLAQSQAGFTMDDFIKANKGDIVFAVTDVRTDSANHGDVNMLFATSIGDKTSFAKLIEAGKKIGGSMIMGSEDRKISFNSNDDYFAIGNNKENVDKYIASTTGTPDFFSKISGSPAGGYINFQYFMNAMKSQVRDSIDNEIFQASLKIWDNLVAKGGEMKDDAITQHIEVNLVDKSTNSLKQLNTYLGTMSVLQKKKKEKREKEWGNWDTDKIAADTSVMVVPAH